MRNREGRNQAMSRTFLPLALPFWGKKISLWCGIRRVGGIIPPERRHVSPRTCGELWYLVMSPKLYIIQKRF
jgi:hypothetical protein